MQVRALSAPDRQRSSGAAAAARAAVDHVSGNGARGFWIHFDADVMNDEIMPAVDYRLPDGLQWDELSAVLKVLMASGQAVGINIGIFNPRLDADGSIARRLVASLIVGLREQFAV